MRVLELGAALGNFMQVLRNAGVEHVLGVVAWDVWEHLERPAEVFQALIDNNPTIQVIALSTVDSGALISRLRGVKWR